MSAPDDTADTAGTAGTADIRVLLVDDQDLFREGVRVIVDAQDGMRVVGTAADGEEAVRLVVELQPDVVLMDIRMPVMDGVEATRRIFAGAAGTAGATGVGDAAARRTPVRVVVLTTFNLDDRAATAIRYGASGFLLKDTTPVQLRDAIRTVHTGNAVLAPTDLVTLLDTALVTPDPPPRAFTELTEREREVFDAVARGLSNAEISARVFTSESTVKTHVGAILRKLALRDRVQIVVFAHEHGLV
ncbi:response regulator transcription factor [uncultured Nocardioides sp.]|uniref:response regulator n=1 Tax=uncultured Nocardioides sp. TaxID=198441 RepID=UPI002613ED4E|nr:response regulator transcription factor [uncultured Nocardioides sp.]